MGGRFRPRPRRINRRAIAADETRVESVFHVGTGVGLAPKTLVIGFILGEQQLGAAVAIQPIFAEFVMRRLDCVPPGYSHRGLWIAVSPRPGVAEPECGQKMQSRRLRS